MCIETLHTVLDMSRKIDRALQSQEIDVKIVKLHSEAILPKRATSGSAAYDVYVPTDYTLKPGRQIIPLGIAIQLPYGYEAKIEPRSGFSSKGMQAQLAATTYRIDADVIQGKIDSDYTGEIGVIVKSFENKNYVIKQGTRIAQLTIYKVETANFREVSELDCTERGQGGFGSTGTK